MKLTRLLFLLAAFALTSALSPSSAYAAQASSAPKSVKALPPAADRLI